MQISPSKDCAPKSQERKGSVPWNKGCELVRNPPEQSLPQNASLEGSWACSNPVNFSKGDQAGFQGFLHLVCLVTATVLRLKAGSFLGFCCFCGMGSGSSPVLATSWMVSWSAHQLFHLKRLKTNHLPDFPSALGSLILFLPEKTSVWSRVVN